MSKNFPIHKKTFISIFSGYDKTLLVLIIGLLLFGLIAVFNASIVAAFRDFKDQYHFLKDQILYAGVGFLSMFVISRFDYHRWYKLSVPLLFGILILLFSVFIPGIGVHVLGARRWIDLGFFTLQPTEFAKLVLVIYLSAWFAYREKSRFVPFLVFLGIVIGLVILQPDLGTAVIIGTIAVVLYFLSGASLSHFLFLIPLGLVAVFVMGIIAPYRLARITDFRNVHTDPLGGSYHVRQVLIALGSGGWLGVGFGKSRQKYGYLPEASTDSIFAIIAEEIGFIGVTLLICAFILVTLRAFKIAQHAPDRFGQLLGTGIATWFAVQTLINLSSMVALIPLTGVPLPFISYGGSNLISLLVGFGILFNIGRHAAKRIT